jgi:secondary thiamine-phosphate synthase enzyme
MRQALHSLHIQTKGKGLVEIGGGVSLWIQQQNISTGLLTIFCRHTSASLLIQENADPDVRTDLESFFEAIAPEDNKRYAHRTEGLDDMPAHIRAALSQTQLAVPIVSRRMVLGTWQGIYLFERRRRPTAEKSSCISSETRRAAAQRSGPSRPGTHWRRLKCESSRGPHSRWGLRSLGYSS